MKFCLGAILMISGVLFIPSFVRGQEAKLDFEDNGEFITKLLARRPQQFETFVKNADHYEIQIIYTRINRDENNRPNLKNYAWHLQPQQWFSPASLVKLPVAAMALEKLNLLKIDSLNKWSRMETGSAQVCQSAAFSDPTSPSGYPSIAQYIKKIFLVSDNDAYNRLYEFLGQKYMNDRLGNMGYPNARILHRYWNCGVAENRCTNPITFYDSSGNKIYSQPAICNPDVLSFPYGEVGKGNATMDENGIVHETPMDFTFTNFISLSDLHQILISIMLPKTMQDHQRFRLTENDYIFLRTCMSTLPRESNGPVFDPAKFQDSYVKYFMFGDSKDSIPSTIRIFNKVGQAYGYLSDCAYIVDYEKKVEFFLTAVIYVNEDGVMNDNKYDYQTIGMPFLSSLGKIFYDYECSRSRKFAPKLRAYPPGIR